MVKDICGQDLDIFDSAKIITSKFKRLEKGFNIWSKTLSNLASFIKNSNELIMLFDTLEEYRELCIEKWNGKNIVKDYYFKLLQYQTI